MLITYLYDGSFEGFLTCIYEAYYCKNKPDKIECADRHVPDLIHKEIEIITSKEHAESVLSAIERKISKAAAEKIYICFLSEDIGCEMLLLNYIRLGFNLGSHLELHMHNSIVREVNKINGRVLKEAHLLLGFIRFKLIKGNLLYSAIEPDNNILTLIAPHFAERFSNETWVINDLKRQCAILYNGLNKWILAPLSHEISENLTNYSDSQYEALWKDYYNNIAIKERTNLNLQKRLMPKRYWDHMFETK